MSHGTKNQTESLKHEVQSKALGILEGVPNRPSVSYAIDGPGWINGLARSILGRQYERTKSLSIGQAYYEWAEVSEFSTDRLGRTRVDLLVVRGNRLGDSEGRNVNTLWEFSLNDTTYTPDEYKTLAQLLDAPPEDRHDFFQALAQGRGQ